MLRAGGGVEVRAAEGTSEVRDEFAAAVVGAAVLAVAFPNRSEAVRFDCALPE